MGARRGLDPLNRRAILSAALSLGAAGVVAAASGRGAGAAAGDPLKVDGAFEGAATTALKSSAANAAAFRVENSGGGTGLEVVTTTGPGIEVKTADEVGVRATQKGRSASLVGLADAAAPGASPTGLGVAGFGRIGVAGFASGTEDSTGVRGETGAGVGVHGLAETGTAVRAEHEGEAPGLALEVIGPSRLTGPAVIEEQASGVALSVRTAQDGPAVRGEAATGTGLQGTTADGTALHGVATGRGTALRADGQVSFSTSGTGTIAKGARTATVTGVPLSRNAKILVTLSGDPGPENGLRCVRRRSATSFDVELMRESANRVRFSYFVIR